MRKRLIKSLVFTSAVLVAVLGGVIFVTLKGSLPILSGEYPLPHLSSTVIVEKDAQGIPSIYGKNRKDVTRALGFVHAQDRFFQMDLLRRASAGELAELFGEQALEFDKQRRFHRFKSRVKEIYSTLSLEDREMLSAYSDGVNEGLNALRTAPFEYFVLGAAPRLWTPEDSLLVSANLFFALQDGTAEESLKRMVMRELLPADVYEFLTHNGSIWEAALDSSCLPILPIPEASSFDYLKEINKNEQSIILEPSLGGSNQWAITKNKSCDGRAWLANDMHLELRMPNIWYRALLVYDDVEVSGATLPGTPVVIVGSNRHIAWSFTNAHLTTGDLIPVDGVATHTVIEIIKIKGSESYQLEIEESDYGPILPQKCLNKTLAFRWIAHDVDVMNISMLGFEKVHNVQEALAYSKQVRIPVLNFVVADKEGNIGWTLIGKIPGIDVSEYPAIINPSENYLWTANNRTLGGEWMDRVGTDSYAVGVRSYQIRQALENFNRATPSDSLELQLQTETLFFRRWQELFVSELEKLPAENQVLRNKRQELLRVILTWEGCCDKDSAAYYWIREFRHQVSKAILEYLLNPCLSRADHFLHYFHDFEESVWMVASQQPYYLLPSHLCSWNEWYAAIIGEMLNDTKLDDIKKMTWGTHNVLHIQHPFSRSSKLMGYLLNPMPMAASGDYYVPKTLYRQTGASQRMVVSPGHEEKGVFHMPCGQTGHPLSPFYLKGHDDWVSGTPSPFLPGPPIHKLTLMPETE